MSLHKLKWIRSFQISSNLKIISYLASNSSEDHNSSGCREVDIAGTSSRYWKQESALVQPQICEALFQVLLGVQSSFDVRTIRMIQRAAWRFLLAYFLLFGPAVQTDMVVSGARNHQMNIKLAIGRIMKGLDRTLFRRSKGDFGRSCLPAPLEVLDCHCPSAPKTPACPAAIDCPTAVDCPASMDCPTAMECPTALECPAVSEIATQETLCPVSTFDVATPPCDCSLTKSDIEAPLESLFHGFAELWYLAIAAISMMGFGIVAALMISREKTFSKQLDDINIVLKSSEEQSADSLLAKNTSDIRSSELELQIIEQKVNYS